MRYYKLSLACLMMFLTSGTFLSLIQCIAWAWMLMSYTADYGLWSSVERTFGGKNPCSVCQEVSAARSDDQKKDKKSVLIEKKYEPGRLLVEKNLFITRSESVHWNPFSPSLVTAQADAPPLPPPRHS